MIINSLSAVHNKEINCIEKSQEQLIFMTNSANSASAVIHYHSVILSSEQYLISKFCTNKYFYISNDWEKQKSNFLSPSWHCIVKTNTLLKCINGNRNQFYKYSSWNCDRGLLTHNKLDDIKVYISRELPTAFSVVECNLNRNEQGQVRTNEFSTTDLLQTLHIPGYSIVLPDSWYNHSIARIYVYVSVTMLFSNSVISPLITKTCSLFG